jgi:hypothetical protein
MVDVGERNPKEDCGYSEVKETNDSKETKVTNDEIDLPWTPWFL